MATKKESLYAKLEEAQDKIHNTHREANKDYYVGPAVLIFVGAIGLTVIVGILPLILGVMWALIRASAKSTAQAEYREAVRRGQELRDKYDELVEGA